MTASWTTVTDAVWRLASTPTPSLDVDANDVTPGPAGFFIVALLAYDLSTRRKVHPATIWGGLLLVASQPLRLMIAGTSLWTTFAGWLTQ